MTHRKARLVVLTALLSVQVQQAVPLAYSFVSIRPDYVTKTLELNSPDNPTRLLRLRQLLDRAGCHKEYMRELPVRGAPQPDVICTLPGVLTPRTAPDTRRTLVVARYDHSGPGSGMVDNWTGAAMLPLLYESLFSGYREHTIQFVAVFGPDGLSAFLMSLKSKEKESTVALVDLRSIGMEAIRIAVLTSGPNNVPDNDFSFKGSVGGTDPRLSSPQATSNAGRSGTNSSNDTNANLTELRVAAALTAAHTIGVRVPEFSAPYIGALHAKPKTARDEVELIQGFGIPGVVIHSISKANSAIPGSEKDSPDQISQADYYATYYYTCVYLLALDRPATSN